MVLALILLGLVAGTLAGVIGIAGGVFIVPALVFLFHFPQKMAQGTTLAVLLPPIGLGAAYIYWRGGNVNVRAAVFIALGFIVGGVIGGLLSEHLSAMAVQRAFGVFSLVIAIKLLFF